MKYGRSEHSSFHDSLLKSGRPEENMEACNINATISIKLLPAPLDSLNFANAFNETFTGIFNLASLLFYGTTFIYIIGVYFTI